MRRHDNMHINGAVEAAQQGDDTAREGLLAELSPHILRIAGAFRGRHITPSEDEYSVGLLAMNEAIDKYDPHKGASFLNFFETVFKRRLIDNLRRQARIREVPRSALQDASNYEDLADLPAEVHEAEIRYQDDMLVRDRAAEIAALSHELGQFGMSFADLPAHSPKHSDARRTAISLATALVGDGGMWTGFVHSGLLPITLLASREMVSRKTVERNRKYIIAVALILSGDYPLLRQYVGGTVNG